MIGFIVQAIFTAAGLWIASRFVPGVAITATTTLALAALLLGVVNALVRPIAVLLTLPLTIITLGLFLLGINAAMGGLTAMFLKGFQGDGFVSALLCAIVAPITSWIGSMLFSRKL